MGHYELVDTREDYLDETGGHPDVEAFLKAAGNGSEKVDKLTLKKKDLIGRDGSIIVVTQ